MTLKLGLIGISEGNGHPYSWSAILNGYNAVDMERCGFPVIPRYLKQQSWPHARLKEGEVFAVWTQDHNLSKHISASTNIPHVVCDICDMLPIVDGVLLARDDAENHLKFARPVLEAGLPIYIDKPIALSIPALDELYKLEKYPGQIFSCSALRYSPELELRNNDREALGEIKRIAAYTPKSWSRYAVHIIEPVLKMLESNDSPIEMRLDAVTNRVEEALSLSVKWKSGVYTSFTSLGNVNLPIRIRVEGTKSCIELTFLDSFNAFRAALKDFIEGALLQEIRSPKAFNERVVSILERGNLNG